jgi:hypothetical protein
VPPTTANLDSWKELGVNGRAVKCSVQIREDALWLRVGDREWELNDAELQFVFRPNDTAVTSEFTVIRAGRPEFIFRYLHVGLALAAKLDPTYDALDYAAEHRLSVIAEHGRLQSWQEAYVKHRRQQPSAA